jgi:hypothetical protein
MKFKVCSSFVTIFLRDCFIFRSNSTVKFFYFKFAFETEVATKNSKTEP